MTTKHTPGPWQADGLDQKHDADRTIFVMLNGGNRLGIGRAYGEGVLAPSNDERIANARLIAAAPELANELRRMTEMFGDTCDDQTPEQAEAIAAARAALAAAEG